jgi:predicted outer membrane lipoprotein
MLLMTDRSTTPQTSDICLLLRAHGEQRWLIYEVIPVVRQLEQRDGLPSDQLGAAFAYLEALWIEARDRARDTDAAYAELEPPERGGDYSVHEKARRYHTAVRRLRTSLAQRVERLLAAPNDIPARQPITHRYASF